MTTLILRRDIPKTERLVIKIWQPDKAALKRMAEAEGEPVAVIARRIIRRAVREYMAANAGAASPPAQSGPDPAAVSVTTGGNDAASV